VASREATTGRPCLDDRPPGTRLKCGSPRPAGPGSATIPRSGPSRRRTPMPCRVGPDPADDLRHFGPSRRHPACPPALPCPSTLPACCFRSSPSSA
jgi:hypothetical protein